MTTLPGVVERSRPVQDDQATRLRAMVQAISSAGRGTGPASAVGTSTTTTAGPRAKVIAITSGKGGVGKTNLSVNLSIALAQLKRRTTLLDADLGLANADLLCGITPARRLDRFVGVSDGGRLNAGILGEAIGELSVDAPGGFKLVPGAAGVSRMADLSPHEQARLLAGIAELERSADLLLIDTAAGLGRDVLSMIRIADLALVVATPEPTSIADAYALVKCAVMAGNDRGAHGLRASGEESPGLVLVINQAVDAKEAVAVHARIAGVSRKFLGYELPLLGWVPRDDKVSDAVRKRRPLLLEHPRSQAARGVQDLALAALAAIEPKGQARPRRLEGLSDLWSRLILRGR
jgi:flagellar biosynthesis protein FlhG